jgi:LacI family transcriptional regulator
VAKIEDVAVRARVSVGTVSNVLNRPHAVAPTTRERVLAAIAELGYVPHGAARTLKAGRSRMIGLVVPDITNPFFADIARGAERVADEHGLVVALYNSADSVAREVRYIGRLEEQRTEGVLITPVGTPAPQLDGMRRRGTPVVLVDRAPGPPKVCSVAVDDTVGGALAVDHLLAQGHTAVAFVGGPLSITQIGERLGGARARAERAGVELDVIETARLDVTSGREAGAELATRPRDQRPTAVFCANDLIALGVLQAATREGLRIPEDLAIIGYDDIDYAAAAAVPLSSVRQPREQLGRVAAELLFAEIAGSSDHHHQQVVFQPELVARRSTGA